MRIVALVACDLNGAIGKQGDLPWRLPSDLARFKQRTMGAPIIMGRKTYESIGRPLPGRLNIVISRTSNFEGVIMARSPAAAVTACGDVEEAFIIGGGEIYRLALENNLVDRIYLTRVHKKLDGDTFFPELNDDWKLISSEKHRADEKHIYSYSFEIHEK
jgi:dihydrofolate reductase